MADISQYCQSSYKFEGYKILSNIDFGIKKGT